MNKTRFTFIRDRRGLEHLSAEEAEKHPGIPVGCLAYRIDCEKGTFEYELSTHDPIDDFDRKMARFVAQGRLDKHPKILQFDPKNALTPPQLLRNAAQDLIDHPAELSGGRNGKPRSVPKRVLRALADHLKASAPKTEEKTAE